MKVQDVVPISPDIDPLGILAGVEGAIYTSDNEVQYFERIGKEGKSFMSGMRCSSHWRAAGSCNKVG